MWFGTYDGLNLYNGKEVITFRFEYDNPNSLSGNLIHNIIAAGKDHLWITTQLGLDKFSLKERKVVESYPQHKRIDLLSVDSNGNSWLINKDNIISYYDIKQKAFLDIPLGDIKISDVKSMFIDRRDVLCLILRNGDLHYVSLANKNEAKKRTVSQVISFHNKPISQAFNEDDQIYFIDDNQDLFVFDYAKQQKILIRNIASIVNKYGLISNLTFFQNEIYIAFMHSGLLKLNASNHENPEIINMTIGIFSLLKDRFQEAMWVGTDGQGVGLYYTEKDKFGNILLDHFPFTARRPVRAMYTDEENTLWIGTKGDGIMRVRNYDKTNNSPIPSANIQHFVIQGGIYENPVYKFIRSKFNRNDLWIGTNGNVSYFSYKDNKLYPLSESVRSESELTNVHTFCEVNDSTLWVSSRGLYKVIVDKSKKPYKIKSKKFHRFFKDGVDIDEEFYSMIYDGDSTILLGSRRGYGVIRFNIYTSKYHFLSMSKAENKALGDVLCLYIDKDSVLYIGATSGLTQIKMYKDRENEIKQFNRKDGIINDMIHGILEDNEGIIWLSTNKGLVKYNPRNDSFFNVKSSQIGVSEFSDGAYLHCPITNRLFFGGVNGLTWIEPKAGISNHSYEPELLFTELKLFGKVQTLYEYNEDNAKKLTLKVNQNTFQIFFTVIDYINGDNYDYAYQLENYNNTWVSLQKENSISFTNLPPGKYTLKVKYKNDVVQADNKVYSLTIVILPPWYLSTIAYIIYFILFVLAIYFSIYYIRLKYQKKQSLIAQRIKEEQKERLYESKLRFFTNITHELYTPLTLINGALEQIQKDETSDRVKKYSGILQNNVLSLNELIQEVLDFRKIEESEITAHTLKNVNVSNVLNTMLTSFMEISKHNNIDLIFSIPDNLTWQTDRACFKKIVSNLISNAFKYTPVGGTVKVEISTENDSLKLIVLNTGKGIEQSKLKSIFNRYSILENTDVNANNQMTARNGLGLYICHSMTKLLHGEINVESVLNEYTRFTVLLPRLIPAESSEEPGDSSPDTVITLQQTPKPIEINERIQTSKIETAVHKHILIVDDNEEMVELVSDILSAKYKVIKAYSAHEALKILKDQTPSLIITDIMMPEIDGLSFIQMIREDKFSKHLPVIALSAKTEKTDQAKGFDAGADAYVTKPFSSDLLLSVVCRLLSNKEDLKQYYDSAESSFEYTDGKLIHQKDKEFVNSIIIILSENISNIELGPDFVSGKLKMSSRNLNRELKRILSITPSDFIKDFKLTYAAKLLLSTNLSVKEIICKIGITNKSYFYNEFARKYNTSPKQYKTENQKESEK
jgi:signal transduction histidine kinase/CheY-like chemotaxis protein/ligand-binding sensor domain-containing protein